MTGREGFLLPLPHSHMSVSLVSVIASFMCGISLGSTSGPRLIGALVALAVVQSKSLQLIGRQSGLWTASLTDRR